MALPAKPTPENIPQQSAAAKSLDTGRLLPGARRGSSGRGRRPGNALYPRLMAVQVTEEMYELVKAEVARRQARGEPYDVASMGAVTREALAVKFGIQS